MTTRNLTRPRSAGQPASPEAPRWPLVALEIGAGLVPLFTGRRSDRRDGRRPSMPARRKRERSTRRVLSRTGR